MIRCARCGKYFGGLSGFEMHRVGRFVDVHPDYGRRCLSDEEMVSKGMRQVGEKWCLKPPSNVEGSRNEAI